MTKRISSSRSLIGVVLFLLAVVFPSWAVGADQVLYFAGLASGPWEDQVFQVEFQFINQSGREVIGQLNFMSQEGVPWPVDLTPRWTTPEGRIEIEENRAEFTISDGSSLLLVLKAKTEIETGWARLEASGGLDGQALLQFARVPDHDLSGHFEDGLKQEARIFPTEALKSFVFPTRLFSGFKKLETGFSVVNVSGIPGAVTFSLSTMGIDKTVTLAPGQFLSEYFLRFFPIALPAVFPSNLDALIEVRSQVPLAATVFRTLQDIPASGVEIIPIASTGKIIQPELGQEFELALDETAIIEPTALALTLWDVAEDSRCPIDVVCVSEGRASVVLRAHKGDEFLRDVTLSTPPGEHTVTLSGYTIRLLRVDPQPTSDLSLRAADYRITLVATEFTSD